MDNLELDDNYLEIDSSEGYIDFYGIIRDFLTDIVHYWLEILLVLSMCASIGYIYERCSYEPGYKTSAVFVVDITNAVTYDNTSKYQSTMGQISKTFPKLASTSAFQKMILSELGLDKIPEDLYIHVSALSDTSLITINIWSHNPDLSYNTLQAVLKCYPEIAKYVLGNIDIEMIDNEGMPTEPVKEAEPKKRAFYGALIGLIFCFIISLIHVFLKKTIRQEEDFEEIFNINCFGSIPLVHLKSRSNINDMAPLFKHRGAGYDFNEAIRSIRNRISRDHIENGACIYMVSSALPGEGKSTVSANIALALADIGYRVLLMDLDIRKSSLMEVLRVDSSKITHNFYELLEGEINLDEVIIKGENENFYILASKPVKGKTSEILSHKGINNLFKKAKKIADYIIVDTAPSSLLSDAALLVEHMDAGIFVVCQDYAPVERIRDGIEMLLEGGLRIGGCILNMKETHFIGYGYKYGYKYEYYQRYDSEDTAKL